MEEKACEGAAARTGLVLCLYVTVLDKEVVGSQELGSRDSKRMGKSS